MKTGFFRQSPGAVLALLLAGGLAAAHARPVMAETTQTPSASAMVNTADGTPLGVATIIGVSSQGVILIGAASEAEGGACIVLQPGRDCLPQLRSAMPLSDFPDLAVFFLIDGGQAPLIPPMVPDDVDFEKNGLGYTGRSRLADWVRPLKPATVSAHVPNGVVISHESLTALDLGAAVDDGAGRLFGVVTKVDQGQNAALVRPMSVLLPQLRQAGIDVTMRLAEPQAPSGTPASAPQSEEGNAPPSATEDHTDMALEMLSATKIVGSLPARSALELGQINMLHTGFVALAPRVDERWATNFVTDIDFKVFSLNRYKGSGRLEAIRTIFDHSGRGALSPSGHIQSFPKRLSVGYYAACAVHSLPSEPDRRAFVLTIWHLETFGYPSNAAGPEIIGWADSDTPCLDGFKARKAEIDSALNVRESPGGDMLHARTTPASNASIQPGGRWHGAQLTLDEWPYVDGRSASVTNERSGDWLSLRCTRGEDRALLEVDGPGLKGSLGNQSGQLTFAIPSSRSFPLALDYNQMDEYWNGYVPLAGALIAALRSGKQVQIISGSGEIIGGLALDGSSAALGAMTQYCRQPPQQPPPQTANAGTEANPLGGAIAMLNRGGAQDGGVLRDDGGSGVDGARNARARLEAKILDEAEAFCRKAYGSKAELDAGTITALNGKGSAHPDLAVTYRGFSCAGVKGAALKPGGFCGLTMDGLKCQRKVFSIRDGDYEEIGRSLE